MEIRKVENDKKQYIDLLLLADEQESMIDRYLDRGELFALYDQEILRGVCVVTKEDEEIYEIKNIATYEQYHGMGYGKAMVEFVLKHYKPVAKEIIVGTGDSPLTVPFYEKCGFTKYRTVKDFITNNYDHPIYEEGKQLVDMVYLKHTL